MRRRINATAALLQKRNNVCRRAVFACAHIWRSLRQALRLCFCYSKGAPPLVEAISTATAAGKLSPQRCKRHRQPKMFTLGPGITPHDRGIPGAFSFPYASPMLPRCFPVTGTTALSQAISMAYWLIPAVSRTGGWALAALERMRGSRVSEKPSLARCPQVHQSTHLMRQYANSGGITNKQAKAIAHRYPFIRHASDWL